MVWAGSLCPVQGSRAPRVAANGPVAHVEKAARLLEAGKLDEAEALLEARDPAKYRDADGLHLLGLVKVRKGRLQEGMAMIERSIIAAPDKRAAALSIVEEMKEY